MLAIVVIICLCAAPLTSRYQKRGLPHCHMLLILKRQYIPRTSFDYDVLACAELPPESDDPAVQRLSSIVRERPSGPVRRPFTTAVSARSRLCVPLSLLMLRFLF